MSWIFLAILGIIWAACCFPRGSRSPRTTVKEFEHGMDRLADVGQNRDVGRFILAPRKGIPFLGLRERARVRARVRRRRVLTFLLEATGLTALMGMFPPFRPMFYATGAFFVLLVGYVGILVWIKETQRDRARHMRHALGSAVARYRPQHAAPAGANGNGQAHRTDGRSAHPIYNHLGFLDPAEGVHVRIRRARKRKLVPA
jgi:hypothetical protein